MLVLPVIPEPPPRLPVLQLHESFSFQSYARKIGLGLEIPDRLSCCYQCTHYIERSSRKHFKCSYCLRLDWQGRNVYYAHEGFNSQDLKHSDLATNKYSFILEKHQSGESSCRLGAYLAPLSLTKKVRGFSEMLPGFLEDSSRAAVSQEGHAKLTA